MKDTQPIKTVSIHGKDYVTVDERVRIAHEDNDKTISVTTELLTDLLPTVVFKATVITKKGTFTGTSAANPAKAIEKQNPYEVAETSAVGRALGFAGYGLVGGIASADEITKSQPESTAQNFPSEISDKQRQFITSLAEAAGIPLDKLEEKYNAPLNEWTLEQASKIIKYLQGKQKPKADKPWEDDPKYQAIPVAGTVEDEAAEIDLSKLPF